MDPSSSAPRDDVQKEVRDHMARLTAAEQEFIALIKDSTYAKDGRWASIAITKIEEATMAARRAFAMANATTQL